MTWLTRAVSSSIGRKMLMGITGLLLWFYLLVHLAGNLAFFAGRDAFNGYAEFLESLPIVTPIEVGLLLVFLAHILLGIVLTVANRSARSGRYAVRGSKADNTLTARTMIWSGAVIFLFLLLHVNQFRFGDPTILDHGTKDYYSLEADVFGNVLYSVWYIFAVTVLGFHVGHGFQSAFRSFGVNHDKYTPAIEWISRATAVVFALAFAALPLFVLFGGVE